MARFPRNESDNSLDMVAYDKLDAKDQKLAVLDLIDKGTTEELEYFQEQNKILKQRNLEKLAKQEKELEELNQREAVLKQQAAQYTAAFQKDMENSMSQNTVSKSSKPNKKSVSCALF